MYSHPDAVPHSVRMSYISLLILTFLNRCISVKTGLNNTKLGNLVNLGALFLTMWINSCYTDLCLVNQAINNAALSLFGALAPCVNRALNATMITAVNI